MICFISPSRESSIAIRKVFLKDDIFSYQNSFPSLENAHGIEDCIKGIPSDLSVALIDSVSNENFAKSACIAIKEIHPGMTVIVLYDKGCHKSEKFRYYDMADHEIDMSRGDEPSFSLSSLLLSLGYMPRYEYRHLKLIKDDHSAIYLGLKMKLTEAEYRILLYMCTNAEKILSSERILSFCFAGSYRLVRSNIKHHVSHINKKSKALGGRNLILTVRGKGYMINELM